MKNNLFKEDCKTCTNEKCRLHPQYQAKRKPRCSCKECWDIWNKKQISEAIVDVKDAVTDFKFEKLSQEEKKKLKEEFDALDKDMMAFFDRMEKRQNEQR